jgi:hypothetical protein
MDGNGSNAVRIRDALELERYRLSKDNPRPSSDRGFRVLQDNKANKQDKGQADKKAKAIDGFS